MIFKVYSSLNGSMVGGLLDDEFDWLQAGWCKISPNPQLCVLCTGTCGYVSLLCSAAREVGSPSSWLSSLMWSGALNMLILYWRPFWNTPESRNLGRNLRQCTSDPLLLRTDLKGHNLILFLFSCFFLLKKPLNSQMLQGCYIYFHAFWQTKINEKPKPYF